MLRINESLSIPEGELAERFIRASGPGGQNVNKVATAVQLSFDAGRSRSLPPALLSRLVGGAGSRATRGSVLIITARRHRTQERNRQDARERLAALIRAATRVPKRRRPTSPKATARLRRLATKRRRGATKRFRQRPPDDE